MQAGADAGPPARRYWATLIASALMVLLALTARPVTVLLASVPASYIVALAGLAILTAFQDALGQAFGGGLRFGAMIAFVVAASSFTCAGLPSACWALVAGIIASLVTEHDDLLRHWRSSGDSAWPPPQPPPPHAGGRPDARSRPSAQLPPPFGMCSSCEAALTDRMARLQ